jgi:hypothetical protein
MNLLDSYNIQCPWCGETIDILIDHSIPSQAYVEDCSVCCQPILITVTHDDEQQTRIQAYRENE